MTTSTNPSVTAPGAGQTQQSGSTEEQGARQTRTHQRPVPADQPRLRLIKGGGTQQLTLPYEYDVAPGVPAVPPVSGHLRLVPDASPADSAASISPTMEHPGRWTERMARAIAEVAAGERPPGQLQGRVSRDVQTYLTLHGQSAARHPASRAARGATRLRSVTGVRVCPVAPGVVETSAVLVGSQRSRAMALWLEARGDQWVATAVQLG